MRQFENSSSRGSQSEDGPLLSHLSKIGLQHDDCDEQSERSEELYFKRRPLSNTIHGTLAHITLRLVLLGIIILASFFGGYYYQYQVDSCHCNHQSHTAQELPEFHAYDEGELSTVPADIRRYIVETGSDKWHTKRMVAVITDDMQNETSFLPAGESPPLYRQAPSEAVDEFWARFNQPYGFLISAEDMKRLGKDPSKYARTPDEWYGPNKTFIARFDTLHLIHCLNVMRRSVHRDYYFPDPSQMAEHESKVIVRHADHCVAALYEFLTCHVTYDVYTHLWVEREASPQPDHATNRQCRDVDPLLDFVHENNVAMDARVRYLSQEEDDFIVPLSPKRKQMFEWTEEKWKGVEEGSPVETIQGRKKDLAKAIAEWKATGEIPVWDPTKLAKFLHLAEQAPGTSTAPAAAHQYLA